MQLISAVLYDEKLYAKTSVFKVMVTIFCNHQDFHIFGPLKNALKGCEFQSGTEVQQAVCFWFHQHSMEFYKKRHPSLGEISGSHGKYEDDCLLGCFTM
jgi:hypothetical protein